MDSTHDRRSSFSCDGCRRRKSKCDRGRPQCGNCVMSGNICIMPSESRKRGPKKGQMQALRAQIGKLPAAQIPTSTKTPGKQHWSNSLPRKTQPGS